MRARGAAFVLVAALASPALADKEQPLDAFLEQRVAEELAADGTLLSRLGVTLEVELVGDAVLVSLVDASTHRAVASTKVDRVPGDREAAVAQLTQIAASLTAQVTRTASPDPDEPLAAREYTYRQHEVTFGGSSSEAWSFASPTNAPFLGVMHRPLTETEFFEAVDRSDLADEYRSRVRWGLAGVITGPLVITGGMLLFRWDNVGGEGGFHASAPSIAALGLVTVGWLATMKGAWLLNSRFPVSKKEAYDLADAHNRRARVKYHLPVELAPYATGTGAGVALGGGF